MSCGSVYHPSNLINLTCCEISHNHHNLYLFFPYACEIHHQKDNCGWLEPPRNPQEPPICTSLGGRGPAPVERRFRLGLSFANGWMTSPSPWYPRWKFEQATVIFLPPEVALSESVWGKTWKNQSQIAWFMITFSLKLAISMYTGLLDKPKWRFNQPKSNI